MEKDVVISIRGMQKYDGADEDSIELVTEGRLTDRGEEGLHLVYQESELTGMEGTQTSFQIEKNGRVTLVRSGGVNSQMVFEVGKSHLSLYQTPYGDLSIGVRTDKIRNTLEMTGGELEIQYAIEIDQTMAGHNIFHIQVRENNRADGGLLQ